MLALAENAVRSIEKEGLQWKVSKLISLAYSIEMLEISSVIDDEKVSTDSLTEEIVNLKDLVQSIVIDVFNKI